MPVFFFLVGRGLGLSANVGSSSGSLISSIMLFFSTSYPLRMRPTGSHVPSVRQFDLGVQIQRVLLRDPLERQFRQKVLQPPVRHRLRHHVVVEHRVVRRARVTRFVELVPRVSDAEREPELLHRLRVLEIRQSLLDVLEDLPPAHSDPGAWIFACAQTLMNTLRPASSEVFTTNPGEGKISLAIRGGGAAGGARDPGLPPDPAGGPPDPAEEEAPARSAASPARSISRSAPTPPDPSARARRTGASSGGAASGSSDPPMATYCCRNAKNSSGDAAGDSALDDPGPDAPSIPPTRRSMDRGVGGRTPRPGSTRRTADASAERGVTSRERDRANERTAM